MSEKLTQLIERFLAERRKSDYGGYAEVSKKDLEQLNRIVSKLIETKFEADTDGDYPVEFELTNRLEERRGNFMGLPYPHVTRQERELENPPTQEQKEEKYFDIAFFNLQIAMNDFDLAAKQQQRRKQNNERTKHS